ELMNALRGELSGFVPGDEHDKGVAAGCCQRAIGLLRAVNRAVDIGAAVNRQIQLAAAQPVHLAPLRIELSEMRPESLYGLSSSGHDLVLRWRLRLALDYDPGAQQRLAHQDGQGGVAVGDVGAVVPALQDLLCLVKVSFVNTVAIFGEAGRRKGYYPVHQ